MARWVERRRSRSALFSRRLAVFFLPVILIAGASHRFGIISTPALLTTLSISWAAFGVALVAGLVGLSRIWEQGIDGLGDAIVGILLGGVMLVPPAYMAFLVLQLPLLNDISTDTVNPPPLTSAAALRPDDAGSTAYPGARAAVLQQEAYPQLRTYRSALSPEDTFDAVIAVINAKGWTISTQSAPVGEGEVGSVEAVATSRILGFADDVAVRITPDGDGALVDIRSASRYGLHDLGANARRVRDFLFALREEIAPTSGGER